MVCREQSNAVSERSQKSSLLRSLVTIDDHGNTFVPAGVRSVVLCSIEGEDLKIKLVSPLKKK